MRITREDRADIARRALNMKFRERQEQFEKDLQAFGLELYKHEFGAVEPQARAMPTAWIKYGHLVSVRCDGFSYRGLNGFAGLENPDHQNKGHDVTSQIPLGGSYPFPAAGLGYIEIPPEHPFRKQAQKLVKEFRKIVDDKEELRQKISALLASCNTRKQLMVAWPEGECFFPAEVKYSTALVPVSLTADINRALGLKPKASTAAAAIAKAASK